MKHDPIRSGKRKAVNVSIDTGIVAAARDAGINLSQACEEALRSATKVERDRRWLEDSRKGAEAWNVWVEDNGIPLAQHRQF